MMRLQARKLPDLHNQIEVVSIMDGGLLFKKESYMVSDAAYYDHNALRIVLTRIADCQQLVDGTSYTVHHYKSEYHPVHEDRAAVVFGPDDDTTKWEMENARRWVAGEFHD